MVPPFDPFCSVKYLNVGQRLPIRTAHYTFLVSGHPEDTKNPYYVLSPQEELSSWTKGSTNCFQDFRYKWSVSCEFVDHALEVSQIFHSFYWDILFGNVAGTKSFFFRKFLFFKFALKKVLVFCKMTWCKLNFDLQKFDFLPSKEG